MFDLDMGKYAAFVWPAWGISAVVLAALSARALLAARRWKAELAALEQGASGPKARPQAAQRASGPEARPQAAQGALGPEARPQAAQGALGPKE